MKNRFGTERAIETMTDDEIQTEIDEINMHLAACSELKPGPWRAEHTGLGRHWHDDPRHHTMHVQAPLEDRSGYYTIAGGTIYDTQREVIFMAEMRTFVPQLLEAQREALVQILALRKKLKRKRAR